MWEIVNALIPSDIIIVSPRATFTRLFALAQTGLFWQSIATSMWRIVRGFLYALTAGVIFATLSARFRVFHHLITPAVKVINAVPIASFTILALMAFHSSNLSIFIAFVTVLPIVYFNTLKGIESTDPRLLEMAQVFRVPAYKKIFFIYTKTVAPHFVSAATTGIGFAWKSGIAAELIGVVSGTIGAHLHTARIFLNTADLFAWTIAIVLLSYLMERVFYFICKFAGGNSFWKKSLPPCTAKKRGRAIGATFREAESADKHPPSKKLALELPQSEVSHTEEIVLNNISKSFGEPAKTVLRDVNMTFTEGITCIMGSSGAGKTTLANILAGLVTLDNGEIHGLENKRISYVFQEDRLLEWENALTNITFVKNDKALAARLLDEAGLAESIWKKASQLSGGMKRRVALCRVWRRPDAAGCEDLAVALRHASVAPRPALPR